MNVGYFGHNFIIFKFVKYFLLYSTEKIHEIWHKNRQQKFPNHSILYYAPPPALQHEKPKEQQLNKTGRIKHMIKIYKQIF
jgi:hypothetical protein